MRVSAIRSWVWYRRHECSLCFDGDGDRGVCVSGLEERAMSRPTFEEINMEYAWLLSRRSTCARLQVGCVITSVDHRKIISVGYNGGAAGQSNECESLEPGQCGHLHAEENAIINCDAPRGTKKIVHCTDLPCVMCAKRFVNLGDIVALYYERDYRRREGLAVLEQAGIKIIKTLEMKRVVS
jgi:dCMP deaminase